MNLPLPPDAVVSAERSALGRSSAAFAARAFDDLLWDNGFARLPAAFHSRLAPIPVPDPYLIAVSDDVAALIGLERAAPGSVEAGAIGDEAASGESDFVAVAAGSRVPAGADPVAAVYAGHQFGIFVPQLGDGRAHLLGGVRNGAGELWELQLKGAGRTPYSRMADGRAVLRSSIREFLCSEAMYGLGIPTTRALAVVASDLPVFRESVESAAIVTRVAPSFVRFGSFEYFYGRDQPERLRELADYVIETFYPQCREAPQRYLAFLGEVARRTAQTIAQWQGVGFCHGVMNTDNMSILGLTIDYGPFGFIDAFDRNHICNHSDEQGRYAYQMQPQIALWNLYALGQALIPLTKDVERTQAVLDTYREHFGTAMLGLMRAKLGLTALATDADGVPRSTGAIGAIGTFGATDANGKCGGHDEKLIQDTVALLHNHRVDWTLFWRRLAHVHTRDADGDAPARDLFADRAAFDAWAGAYRRRLQEENSSDRERRQRMNRVNPKYILRNHLAETAIRLARGDHGARDFSEVARLLQLLRRPYDEQPQFEAYAALPPDWAGSLQQSCSS